MVTDNYWPLPWYLRKFDEERVCYWLDAKAWKQERDRYPPPAILILSSDVDCDDIAARLAGYGGPDCGSLRPGVFVEVYVRKDLWPAYLECLARNRFPPREANASLENSACTNRSRQKLAHGILRPRNRR